MFGSLSNTPPEIALILGFFLSQGLEKSSKEGLIAKVLPWIEVEKKDKYK